MATIKAPVLAPARMIRDAARRYGEAQLAFGHYLNSNHTSGLETRKHTDKVGRAWMELSDLVALHCTSTVGVTQ